MLDCIHTHGIEHVSLALSCGLAAPLVLGERLPHGPRSLATEVKWLVLLVSVKLAQVLPLVVADDSQDSGNGLSYYFAVN